MAAVVQEKLFVIVTSAERRGHKQYVTILKLVDNVFLPACGQERKELWMKFREKLKQEHPRKVSKRYNGGCCGCPSDYVYEIVKLDICGSGTPNECRKCWDREMETI